MLSESSPHSYVSSIVLSDLLPSHPIQWCPILSSSQLDFIYQTLTGLQREGPGGMWVPTHQQRGEGGEKSVSSFVLSTALYFRVPSPCHVICFAPYCLAPSFLLLPLSLSLSLSFSRSFLLLYFLMDGLCVCLPSCMSVQLWVWVSIRVFVCL